MTHTRRDFLIAAGGAGVAAATFGLPRPAAAETWETVVDGSFASY